MRRVALSPLLPWELEDIALVLSNPAFLALLRHHSTVHLNHLRLLLRLQVPLWPGLLHLVDDHSSALDIASAIEITDRIRQQVEAIFSERSATTLSIGLASYPGAGTNLETLIAVADRALYEAKSTGKNRMKAAHS